MVVMTVPILTSLNINCVYRVVWGSIFLWLKSVQMFANWVSIIKLLAYYNLLTIKNSRESLLISIQSNIVNCTI